MTVAEFRKTYGIGESAAKKPRGRTGDGLQWSKDPEGFGDKRTSSGNPLIASKTEKLTDVSLEEATANRRYIPRKFSDEDKRALKLLVDDEMVKVIRKMEDELPGDIFENEWIFDPFEGWVNKNSRVDFDRTKEQARLVSEESWPMIKAAIDEKFGHLDPEEYNKVLLWARSRSRNAFDVQKGEVKQSFGALHRQRAINEGGSGQTASDKIPVKSGGKTYWFSKDEYEALLKDGIDPKKEAWYKQLREWKQDALDRGITYGNHDPEKVSLVKKYFKESSGRNFGNFEDTSNLYFDDLHKRAKEYFDTPVEDRHVFKPPQPSAEKLYTNLINDLVQEKNQLVIAKAYPNREDFGGWSDERAERLQYVFDQIRKLKLEKKEWLDQKKAAKKKTNNYADGGLVRARSMANRGLV